MLHTSNLLRAIFESRQKFSVADLAYSAHAYLARGLAALATENAIELGVKEVGFSGGAACNQILAKVMRETVEAAGLRFLVHEACSSRRRRSFVWSSSCRWIFTSFKPISFYRPLKPPY